MGECTLRRNTIAASLCLLSLRCLSVYLTLSPTNTHTHTLSPCYSYLIKDNPKLSRALCEIVPTMWSTELNEENKSDLRRTSSLGPLLSLLSLLPMSLCLSLSLSVCLSGYLSVCLSVYLSLSFSVSLPSQIRT